MLVHIEQWEEREGQGHNTATVRNWTWFMHDVPIRWTFVDVHINGWFSTEIVYHGSTMSSFIPHVCPLTEIPLAAKTVTTVFCQTYPLIPFVYGSKLPLPEVPYGKQELLTIYLHQLGITGLVLTVDSKDEKCVAVAVWTAPATANRKSLYERLKSKFNFTRLNIWLFLATIYYRGASMDAQVTNPPSLHLMDD
jgi:hypothetical protein